MRSSWALLALGLALGCSKSGGSGDKPGTGEAGSASGGVGGNPGAMGGAAANMSSSGATTGGGNAAGASGGNEATAGSAGAGGTGGTAAMGPWKFPDGVTKPKIMIVGDSISAGPGCYKKYLLKDLNDNGYSNFEFVGEYTDDCGGGVKHSAVSCSTAEQYTHDMFMMPNCQQGKSFPGMSTLVTKHMPDLVMMQLGVNDVWGGAATDVTLGHYQTLVEQARAQNPNVVLVVAQIQKIRPDCGDDDSVQKRAEALVMAVPAWAAKLSTAQSPVFVADLWTNSDWSMAETLDCVHPNDAGAQKMGMNWFNTLKNILTPG